MFLLSIRLPAKLADTSLEPFLLRVITLFVILQIKNVLHPQVSSL